MDRIERAANLFTQGYNCSQSVAIAFSDLTGLDVESSVKLASSFGAGMGCLREVCGAVSGMFLVLGILYGYSDPEDVQGKREHYAAVQQLAEKFRAEAGSIICREILKNQAANPTPSLRTEEYYAKRPCARMVMLAASILDSYIREREGK
jgi:C_GCAxxG_C_C family probable redox protein